MINICYKKWIYLEVENKFYYYLKKIVDSDSFKDLNTCCNDSEEKMLFKLSEEIKFEYPDVRWKDIYITIIFVYYALVLNEQVCDPLTFSILPKMTKNHKKVHNIIIDIATSDKEYAKKIRRAMFHFK